MKEFAITKVIEITDRASEYDLYITVLYAGYSFGWYYAEKQGDNEPEVCASALFPNISLEVSQRMKQFIIDGMASIGY